MSYAIAQNYSVLNNYHYDDKSLWLSTLDFFSSPCRNVLGGRDVWLVEMSFNLPSSIESRITILFLSALVYYIYSPLVYISVGSLLLKCVFLPWIWQKNQIQNLSKEYWDRNAEVRAKVQELNREGKTIEALQVIRQSPSTLHSKSIEEQNNQLNRKLIRSIRERVSSQVNPWESIQSDIQYLWYDLDAINMVNCAVKNLLAKEPKDFLHIATRNNFRALLCQSLRGRNNLQYFEQCCEKLFTDALKIDSTENPFTIFCKMDLADYLLIWLEEVKKKSYTSNDGFDALDKTLHNLKIDNEIESLRDSMWKKPAIREFYRLFQNPEKMKEFTQMLQKIRTTPPGEGLNSVLTELFKHIGFPEAEIDRLNQLHL